MTPADSSGVFRCHCGNSAVSCGAGGECVSRRWGSGWRTGGRALLLHHASRSCGRQFTWLCESNFRGLWPQNLTKIAVQLGSNSVALRSAQPSRCFSLFEGTILSHRFPGFGSARSRVLQFGRVSHKNLKVARSQGDTGCSWDRPALFCTHNTLSWQVTSSVFVCLDRNSVAHVMCASCVHSCSGIGSVREGECDWLTLQSVPAAGFTRFLQHLCTGKVSC